MRTETARVRVECDRPRLCVGTLDDLSAARWAAGRVLAGAAPDASAQWSEVRSVSCWNTSRRDCHSGLMARRPARPSDERTLLYPVPLTAGHGAGSARLFFPAAPARACRCLHSRFAAPLPLHQGRQLLRSDCTAHSSSWTHGWPLRLHAHTSRRLGGHPSLSSGAHTIHTFAMLRLLIICVLSIVCVFVLQGMGHHSSDAEMRDLMEWMAKCLQA